jgi:hypothetical protein
MCFSRESRSAANGGEDTMVGRRLGVAVIYERI